MDLVEKLRAAGPAIFDDQPVLFAYLYGSRAAGRPRPDSDVDIAIYCSDDTPPEALFDLQVHLSSRIGAAIGDMQVEVVVLNATPIRLAGRVIQGLLVYSRDEAARVAYESLTFREFCDFDLHDQEDAEIMLRATAEGRY